MKRLLIINQYFPPDRAATGILLGQLTEGLSKEFSVTVICGTPTYNPELGRDDPIAENLSVRRVPLLPWSRRFMSVRLLNYMLFTFGSFILSLRTKRCDLIMCWTDPPWSSWVGAVLRFFWRSKLLLVYQDIYPEIIFAAKLSKQNFIYTGLKWFFSWPLKKADHVVVIGEEMIPILSKKGFPRHKMSCIENWQDPELFKSVADKNLRSTFGIPENAFVVMHSGNMGFSQNLVLLLEAAQLLKNESSIWFLLVGDGAAKSRLIEFTQNHQLERVVFSDYQPHALLPASLASGDLHYVSLLPSFSGLVVPSKFYTALLSGTPVITALPPGSSQSHLVNEQGLGYTCPMDPQAIANTILAAAKHSAHVKKMGIHAKNYAMTYLTKHLATEKYLKVMNALCI